MTSVGALGEHRIIALMQQQFTSLEGALPFGDDVAAVPLAVGAGDVAVVKSDMLVAETDVPVGMSVWQAARKAVVAPVSDFAAKGVVPVAVQVAAGFPADFLEADVVEVARGLNSGAREYGAYVVGGDTAESGGLTLAVQVFGTAKREQLMLRHGAKEGDVLAVTGLVCRFCFTTKKLQKDCERGWLIRF